MLVCAYACNPYKGSEDAVGWNWVKAIARTCDVAVITAAYNEKDIARASAGEEVWAGAVRFFYVPHRPWHYRPHGAWLWIEASLLKPIMNWAYRLWQQGAFVAARELAREQRFDLVHQLTYVGFRFPGHLWKMGVPFVWGPLGGLENTPWRLVAAMDGWGPVYYTAHNLVNSAHRRFLRSPRKAVAAAGPGLIAATQGIRRELRRWYGAEGAVICEVTSPDRPAVALTRRAPEEPLRIAWSGAHLPGKALPLLLEALHRCPEADNWLLDIFGSGPRTGRWKKRACDLGIDARCRWHGLVSRAEAIEGLAAAHVFVITSLKDLTSTVLLEALSQGVPVLCPNHCGFGDVVTSECGIALPIDSPARFVGSLAAAIAALYRDEERRRSLAHGARRRAVEFGIDAKAQAVARVYEQVLVARRRENL